MALMTWKDCYSVGVSEIDAQHRKLFLLINDVSEASQNPSCRQEEIERIIDDLLHYVEFHFSSEQRYLVNHPEFAAHRDTHAQFVIATIKFVKRLKENDPSLLTNDLLIFLVNWLRDHILATDVVNFRYLREHDLLPEGTRQSC